MTTIPFKPALLTILLATLLLHACAAPPPAETDYNAAYQRGDYDQAFQAARHAYRQRQSPQDAQPAAYVTGLAANHLQRYPIARLYLERATTGPDSDLAAHAAAELGLLHDRLGNFQQAAQWLRRAARDLQGEDRAQAHYHAALADQKLGRWPQASTQLRLARNATNDQNLQQSIENRLDTTGWTVQLGAFNDPDNAQRLAEQIAEQAAQIGLGSPRLVEAHHQQTLTLVHVGRFSTFHSARDARNQLNATQSIIVPLKE